MVDFIRTKINNFASRLSSGEFRPNRKSGSGDGRNMSNELYKGANT
jgi:hypothetical protein